MPISVGLARSRMLDIGNYMAVGSLFDADGDKPFAYQRCCFLSVQCNA